VLSQKESLSQIFKIKESLGPSDCYSIAVASGKGGVGKSTFSINLALGLSDYGKILLLDGDPGLPDLNLIAGVNPKYHWGDFLAGEQTFLDIKHSISPKLDLIHGFSGMQNMEWVEKEAMKKVIRAMHGVSHLYTHNIIDVGASLNDSSLAFCTTVDSVILVLIPEITSLSDCYSTLKSIWSVKPHQDVKILVNRADSRLQAKASYNNLCQISRQFLNQEPEFLSWLPNDNQVSNALLKQAPILKSMPGSNYSQALQQVILKINQIKAKTLS
jgi:flagellar biosynthesis protein FlhG